MKKKIIFLALVLVILLVVVLFLRREGSTERDYKVFSADSTQIGRIRVISPEDTIIITKSDKGWMIKEPVEWATNSEQLEAFFRDVLGATSSKTIMTDNPDAVERYGLVHGQALEVMVWDAKDKLRDHIYFNNFGQSFDYFRYEGSNEIYQIRTLVSRMYTGNLQNWRSPVLMRIFENVITSIEVTYPENTYRLEHKDDKWIYRDASNAFQIHHENRPLLRALNILNNLDTMVFFDGDNSRYMEAFRNPKCTVVLNLTDGSKRKLTFANLEVDGYALMLDDDPKTLYGIANDTMQRFTINKDYYRQLPYGSTPPPPVTD